MACRGSGVRVSSAPDPGPQGRTSYFAVFEAEFADAGAMTAARASPQGQQVAADVANYATGGAVVIHYPVPDGTG
jgi:hypothetical protein